MPLLSSFARRYQRRTMLPRLVSSQPLIVSRIQRTQRKVQRLQPQRLLRSGSVAGPPREHSAAQRPMVWQGEPVEQGPTPAEQQLSVLRRHLTRQAGPGKDRARPPQRRARRSQAAARALDHERSGRRMPGRQGQRSQRGRRAEPAEIEEPPARPRKRESVEPAQARSEQADPLVASEAEAERGDDIHRAETVWTGEQAEAGRSESPRETRRTGQSERPAVEPHKPTATEPAPGQPDHERAEVEPEPSAPQVEGAALAQRKPPLEEVVQRSSQPTRRAAESDPGELQPPLNQPPRRPQQEEQDGPAITRRETRKTEPAPRGDVSGDRPERRETGRTMRTRQDVPAKGSFGEHQQRRTPQPPDPRPDAELQAPADQQEAEPPSVPPQPPPFWSRAETQLASDPTEQKPPLEEVVNAQASDQEIQRAPAEASAEAHESEPAPSVQRAQAPAPAPARSGPEPAEAGAQEEDEEAERGQDLDAMAQQVFHLLRRRLKVEAERAQGGRL